MDGYACRAAELAELGKEGLAVIERLGGKPGAMSPGACVRVYRRAVPLGCDGVLPQRLRRQGDRIFAGHKLAGGRYAPRRAGSVRATPGHPGLARHARHLGLFMTAGLSAICCAPPRVALLSLETNSPNPAPSGGGRFMMRANPCCRSPSRASRRGAGVLA